jgi:hypothetical protein
MILLVNTRDLLKAGGCFAAYLFFSENDTAGEATRLGSAHGTPKFGEDAISTS